MPVVEQFSGSRCVGLGWSANDHAGFASRKYVSYTRCYSAASTVACASLLSPELGCLATGRTVSPRSFSLLILATQVGGQNARRGVLLSLLDALALERAVDAGWTPGASP
jgi:hypothetical protein